MEKNVYFDSCIWLNLFKKEGDVDKGIPYWKLAKDLIKQIETEKGKICVSTIVLKELYFMLGEKFNEVNQFFKETEFIEIVKTTNEDYALARKFEQEHALLSFYDYLHVAVAKRIGVSLITRDRDLMEFAKNQVTVFKPEHLLS